jgi:hypothetical protein
LEFDDIEIAKQNLERIADHYSMYKKFNEFDPKRNDQAFFEKYKNFDWFVLVEKPCYFYKENGKRTYQAIDTDRIEKYKKEGKDVGTFIYETSATHSIYLYTDGNVKLKMSCAWVGYNNSLNSVEIVEDFSDRKITFR